jgi:polyribonucleotide nucleotidyltransferase
VVRGIQLKTGAEINIQDDGTVLVAAVDHASADAAIEMIREITADVEVGKIYHGTVTRIMGFGAFVSLIGTREGLIHISELAPRRVEQVTDEVNVGDEVDVKVIEVDKMGRVNLSKVQADAELGRIEVPEGGFPSRGDRGDRGDRGGDRGGRDRGGRDRGGRSGGGGGRDRGGSGGGGYRR